MWKKHAANRELIIVHIFFFFHFSFFLLSGSKWEIMRAGRSSWTAPYYNITGLSITVIDIVSQESSHWSLQCIGIDQIQDTSNRICTLPIGFDPSVRPSIQRHNKMSLLMIWLANDYSVCSVSYVPMSYHSNHPVCFRYEREREGTRMKNKTRASTQTHLLYHHFVFLILTFIFSSSIVDAFPFSSFFRKLFRPVHIKFRTSS